MSTSASLLILATIALAILGYSLLRYSYRTRAIARDAHLDAVLAQHLAETNRDRIDRNVGAAVIRPRPRSLHLVKEHHG